MGLTEADLFRAHGIDHDGAPLPEPPSVWDHPVWQKIVLHEGHWIWQGALSHGGPEMTIGASQRQLVVRFLFEMCERPLLPEEIMRNVCGLRRCVMPLHWPPQTRSAFFREVRSRDAKAGVEIDHSVNADPLSDSEIAIAISDADAYRPATFRRERDRLLSTLIPT